MLEQQPVSDIRLSARHGNTPSKPRSRMLRSIFGTERPVQMKSLWPLAWACLQAILADSGTTWFSSARVPSISMNTSLLLVVMVAFVTGCPQSAYADSPSPEGAKKIPPKTYKHHTA